MSADEDPFYDISLDSLKSWLNSYPTLSFKPSRDVILLSFSTLLSLILFMRVSRFISEKILANFNDRRRCREKNAG